MVSIVLFGEFMSAIVLSHAHAARGVNNASAKPGLSPGGSATPADIASFLDALDQALGSRQANTPANLIPQLASNQNNGQNLPLLNNPGQNPANISDPMQMLMAQLMAQGLINQNAQNSNQSSPLNTLNQVQALQSMALGNSQGANQANALQQFDPNHVFGNAHTAKYYDQLMD